MLHCAVQFLLPPPEKKKFAPSLTEQWKMKNACNYAYVQAETLNFIFTQQAIIVWAYCYICSNHRHGYCCNIITSPRIIATVYGDEAKASE